jgi:hypothetical protein
VKILLDECVDRRLAREISGHDVHTVPQMGWAGIKNGDLLTLAEKQFEVFVTVDRNLRFNKISHFITSRSLSCVVAAIDCETCVR